MLSRASGSHEEEAREDNATTTVKSGRLASAAPNNMDDDFDFTAGARGGTRSPMGSQRDRILTTGAQRGAQMRSQHKILTLVTFQIA